jgi:hypothetical protein
LISSRLGAHQVAQLCAHRHPVAQIVITLDQLAPQGSVLRELDYGQS